MFSQTICDHVPPSQLCSLTSAAGKMQSILSVGSELYHYYKDSSSDSLSPFAFVRSSSSSPSCNTKKRQGIRTNAQVVKSSRQICRHLDTVHIFFSVFRKWSAVFAPRKTREVPCILKPRLPMERVFLLVL